MPSWTCKLEIAEDFDDCTKEEAKQAFIESLKEQGNWLPSDIEIEQLEP